MKQKSVNFLIAILICAITGCNSDEFATVSSLKYGSNYETPYDFIGVLHNAAMDSVKKLDIDESQLISFTNKYVDCKLGDIKTYSNDETVNKILSNVLIASHDYEFQTRSVEAIDDSIKNIVPYECQHYIDSIYNLVDRCLTDSIIVNMQFAELDKIILDDIKLDETSRACLLAISAISKFSYKYNINEIATRSISGSSVVKADVGGAIAGVFCWKTFGKAACRGLVFGPGGIVLTVAKEGVRGAICGSALHLVSGGFF